jgi:hypothetical protein
MEQGRRLEAQPAERRTPGEVPAPDPVPGGRADPISETSTLPSSGPPGIEDEPDPFEYRTAVNGEPTGVNAALFEDGRVSASATPAKAVVPPWWFER